MSERATRTVHVELPTEAFKAQPWSPASLAEELRVLWLLEQVRTRRLGHGKAAELADLPRAEFLRLMASHGIDALDFDSDELAAELG